MTLGDLVSAALSLVAIAVIFIPPKIPYGSIMEHLGELGPDGKPVPNKWMVRQARRERLRRVLLLAIAVGGFGVIILRRLGW